MVTWKSFGLLRTTKSYAGAILLNSSKRCYARADPLSMNLSTDEEVEFFTKLADEWWDPNRNILHSFNTVRIPFIRSCIMNAGLVSSTDSRVYNALEGLKMVDVGCGGGILSEGLARLHIDVTGIDVNSTLINIAQQHASRDKVVEKHVKYENIDIRTFAQKHPGEFDAVVVSEVIEHISNKEEFLKLCAYCLKDEGSLLITAPNRTTLSKIFLINLAESLRIIPTGTHDYEKFITPHELVLLLQDIGCKTKHIEGFMYWPFSRKFDHSYFKEFMYGLHAIKNTNKLCLDLAKEANRFSGGF